MKLLGKGILLILVAFALQSCKRDYNCKCFYVKDNVYFEKDTSLVNLIKKDAIYYCEKKEKEGYLAVANNNTEDTMRFCNLIKN